MDKLLNVEVDEDDPIITMVTHLIPDDENEDFDGQAPQLEAPDAQQQGWIGASLQIHQSQLILMQLTAPTCQ
jgi:hypothetical protein